MCVLPVCVSVHHVHAWCPWEPEEGIGSPRTRDTDEIQMVVHCHMGAKN